jgi:hypothetical protein
MRLSALRVQFVVNGASFLAALYAAVLAGHRLVSGDTTSVFRWLGGDPFERPGTAVLGIAGLLGLCSIVGSVIAQTSFRLVGRRLHAEEVGRRLAELRRLTSLMRSESHPALRRRALLAAARTAGPSSEPELIAARGGRQQDAIDALGSIGWATAGPEVVRELEYRRSNRQVFLGSIPAVIVAALAVVLVAADRLAIPLAAIAASAIAAGAWQATRGLAGAARYQDRRIARLLLDVAWASAWLDDAD